MLPNYQARSPFVLKHITSLYIHMCGRKYVILYFDPLVFVFAWWSTPSPYSTNWNPSVYCSLPYHQLFTPLNSVVPEISVVVFVL